MIIGLCTTTEDPIIWLTIRGAMQAAKGMNATLVIYGGATKKGFSEMDGKAIERHFCFNRTHHAGFMAAFAERPMQEFTRELWNSGYPSMLIARKLDSVPHATTNNHEALCAIVKKLADKGHRRIAFLAGPENNYSAAERLAGYKQGLLETGLPYDPELVIQGDYSEKTAHDKLRDILKRSVEFSAILSANDLSAFGILEALQGSDLSPGADVEVIGFDNVARGHWSRPNLSTFDPQLYRIGYQACVELVKCINKEPFASVIQIPAQYVPRESTWETDIKVENKRPLLEAWTAQRFHHDTEFEKLKSNERVIPLIKELEASIDTPESFLQCFHELLDEVFLSNFSAICLTPLLLELEQKNQNPATQALLDDAFGIQTSAVFNEQRQKTASAHNYTVCTTALRELAFSVSKESQVLSVFRCTAAELKLSYAGVYLYDQPAKGAEPVETRGKWYGWALDDFHKGNVPPPLAADTFDVRWLEQAKPGCCWLTLPLLSSDEMLGLVVLEAGSEFITSYSDLVRLFTFALSSARLNAALSRANAELIETSRMAGLAEMATGILHNIGNALNSVNTSCSLLAGIVQKSKIPSVAKTAQLMKEQGTDLGRFLENDPRGQKVPDFLSQLGGHLQTEQKQITHELEELREKVDHINQIVADQQSYAQVSGLVETVAVDELLEFSLKLSEASLTRHKVCVVRRYDKVPPVKVQRQKVVQILVNLIRNAKESMGAAHRAEKLMVFSLASPNPQTVTVSITDNGKGIPPENLSRIFAFGFTTKPGGHGFGLHNSALAAREMKGNLTAQSEGLDKGATFILELPVD